MLRWIIDLERSRSRKVLLRVAREKEKPSCVMFRALLITLREKGEPGRSETVMPR